MAKPEPDPGLPIKLGPVSNGEYDPPPTTPFLREVVRRSRAALDANARRAGMSRRQFLVSACGAATTLAVLSSCSDEARDASSSTTGPGGSFDVPDEATTETTAAEEALGGDEFVFDVQGHLLELDPDSPANAPRFPQAGCGDDPKDCFDTEHFLDLVFSQSDTSMIVLSAIPFSGNALSPQVMARTVDLVERLCGERRVLMQGETSPSVGALEAELEAMADLAERFPIRAWKAYTHSGGPGWYLDDHDPAAPQVGRAFLDQAAALDIPIVAVHKGLSGEDPFASPVDVGPAAAAHPDLSLVIYHSGYEVTHREGPYPGPEGEVRGVDRLVRSLADAGIGPGGNVYAELGSTWRSVMTDPDEAAHLLGKLLLAVGEDNVVWGTDSIWYGSPQDQIEAFRAFRISEEFQERFGYPALTDEVKAKILGLSSARLYGVDPITGRCELTREQLEEARLASARPFATYGPTTAAGARAIRAQPPHWA